MDSGCKKSFVMNGSGSVGLGDFGSTRAGDRLRMENSFFGAGSFGWNSSSDPVRLTAMMFPDLEMSSLATPPVIIFKHFRAAVGV